nr:MAG TPA: hypothetical protein [Caudoviricetes sp.]
MVWNAFVSVVNRVYDFRPSIFYTFFQIMEVHYG